MTAKSEAVTLDPAEVAWYDAEADKYRAEAEAARAVALKDLAEARKIGFESVKYEYEAEREHEKRKDELAAHKYHHVYFFDGQVDTTSARKCMAQLTAWHRQEPTCDFEIIFDSPGGGVTAGLALFDHIQYLRVAGHKVTTSTVGMAASMAGVLLQAGDVRIMGKESWILIHAGSFGAVGSVAEVEDTVEWVKKIGIRIDNIFAARSNLTARQIRRKYDRKDWWVDSDLALSLGLVDEVR